jgi:Ca2+-transporting ATPase
LILAVLSTTILQLSVIYVPILQRFFKTLPLDLNQLLLCIAVSSTIFFLIELDKLMGRIREGRR